MDVIARRSGGQNIVGRPQARPAWYAPASVDAHEVELFTQEIDPTTGAFIGTPKPFGRFPAVGTVAIPHNPDSDRDVVIYAMPYSGSSTPGFSEIAHATQATALFRREVDAPLIGLTADVTVDTAQIGITGFTRFARYRRLRVWADAGKATMLREVMLDSNDYAAHELPRDFLLSRTANVLRNEDGTPLLNEDGTPLLAEDNSGALPQMIYVTVAHSGGVSWTPESNVLLITFASGDGTTPGSTGTFDPKP
ncbi:MAG TPA: hypothetical protein VHU19_14215, partial [Pyrinomonadaceae bacterium]|nr:hypothetical protein [Pyrinomonadaceae bacterium]